MWSLKRSFDSQWDKYLVQAFIGETRILGIDKEEMAEVEIPGFDAQAQTLHCANVIGDMYVQVTGAISLPRARTRNSRATPRARRSSLAVDARTAPFAAVGSCVR